MTLRLPPKVAGVMKKLSAKDENHQPGAQNAGGRHRHEDRLQNVRSRDAPCLLPLVEHPLIEAAHFSRRLETLRRE